jgi:hypothetical protein
MVGFRLIAVFVLAGASCVGQSPLHLIPQPRELTAGTTLALAQGVKITCTSCFTDSADNFAAQDLADALAERHIPTNGKVVVQLVRAAVDALPAEGQAEGYTMTATASGMTLTAPGASGLFYAVQTVKQLIVGDGSSAVMQTATVRDWPAMQYRGMHDDLSRGPVPTLAFQEQLIKTLATYKYNLYSPYFEHTQQYASNPLFAPPGGGISADDARALVAFAARYHVTIVPEQEAFGHLHHNLTWEQYGGLAETPHGTVLAPGQAGSLNLIGQMFTELATLYPGPFLHIGADETVDLGLGQTKADVDSRGLGPVYLDFLQQIDQKLAPLHRRLLWWGDIAQTLVQGTTAYTGVGAVGPDRPDPDSLKKLPASFKKDTVAVAWWYTPNPKGGFAHFLTPFTQAGFETWLAPGVNCWSVVFPDNNDALVNIQQFVEEGQRQHSTGMLNTVWWDDGEGLPNQNWYGLLFGAAAAWQSGEASIPAFEHSFSAVFHGDQTGALDQAQLELMAAHELLRKEAKVGDGSNGLFWIDPWSPDGQKTAAKIRPFTHELRLHAERALTLIAQARAAYPVAADASGQAAAPLVYDPANALPSNPTALRHAEAIDALELGARRMDFIGLKFQLADEMVASYQRALSDQVSPDKKTRELVGHDIGEVRSINGRMEDIRDTYSLLRDLYQQSWLRTNRVYALRPVLEHYDSTIALWQSRIDQFRSVQRQYGESRTKPLPTAQELGLPVAK